MPEGPRDEGPLRVLLVSPVRGTDPASGDVTYTEQLLASPPPGVRYTTYVAAIEAGSLVDMGSRDAVRRAPTAERPLQLAIAGWRKVESLVRRSGLAYREPIRVFRVDPAAFDLVHVHVFRTRFLGPHPPIVVSAGGTLRGLYRDAWHWGPWRIATAEALDRVAGALWDATLFGTRPGRAARFITLSEDFRAVLLRAGWPPTRVDTAPNYLDVPLLGPRLPAAPTVLGFIAKDFATKGGDVALEAFRVLRDRHPRLHLTVVGSPAPRPPEALRAEGITWRPLVSRGELLAEVLPTIDILLYPSFRDTSVPYVPMEALAAGIPCVVSDYGALPELVGADAGRSCPVGDATCVVAAVEGLLDPGTWAAASDAARRRFQERFSAASQAGVLGSVYRRTLATRHNQGVPFTPPATVSVVIATYNRPDHVRTCLEHLARQTLRPTEVLVVDSSPDTRTADVVAAFPGVRHLRNELGRGHTATSRALGMAHTVGDVVAFLDDDAYAEPGWLAALLARYTEDTVAAVGGRTLNGREGEDVEGVDEIGLFLGDGSLTGNFAADPGRDLDVDHVIGANMSVRRDVVERLGGIHDHYPGTCFREETDIQLRMRRAGYRIVFTPAAVVLHVAGTYAKGRRFDTRYQYYASRNHVVLLTHTLGFRDPHLRRHLRAVAVPTVVGDLRAALRATVDPARDSVRSRARGAAGGLVRAAAVTGGTIAGLGASARIALSRDHRTVPTR